MTSPEPEALMFELMAAYPAGAAELTEATISLWVERIAREAPEVATAAVAEVIETWRSWRFPPPAEFARAAAERRAAFRERGHHQRELEVPPDPERLGRVVRLREVVAKARPLEPKPRPRPVPPRPLPAPNFTDPLEQPDASAVNPQETEQ
jgi:hypothetical protein